MTDKEFQQKKYYASHKQYKVYLDKEQDAEVVQILDNKPNRSAFIRRALIHEVNRSNSSMPAEKAEKVLTDELDHTLLHLQDKDMHPDYYKELGEYADAIKYALFAIGYVKEKGGDASVQE